MQQLLSYSQSWGHLIMSVILTAAAVLLILWPTTDATTKAAGVSILFGVQLMWLGTASKTSPPP